MNKIANPYPLQKQKETGDSLGVRSITICRAAKNGESKIVINQDLTPVFRWG